MKTMKNIKLLAVVFVVTLLISGCASNRYCPYAGCASAEKKERDKFN